MDVNILALQVSFTVAYQGAMQARHPFEEPICLQILKKLNRQ